MDVLQCATKTRDRCPTRYNTPMRFGIRLLVFLLAVAPFTGVMVQDAWQQYQSGSLSTWTAVLALFLLLLSAGYIWSFVEAIYYAVVDARDDKLEAEAEAKEKASATENRRGQTNVTAGITGPKT